MSRYSANLVTTFLLFLLAPPSVAWNEEALRKALSHVAFHSSILLTLAGVKPIASALPDGMTAQQMKIELDEARARGMMNNPNLDWCVNRTGVTGKDEIQFFHRRAIAETIRKAESADLLAPLGIRSDTPANEVIRIMKDISSRPESRQSVDEIGAMGVLLGFPSIQVRSYLKAKKNGAGGRTDGRRVFSWFKSGTFDVPGFAVFPEDGNEEELKALQSKGQAVWDQLYTEAEMRKNDIFLILTTFDQQPFIPNPMTRARCERYFIDSLGHQ